MGYRPFTGHGWGDDDEANAIIGGIGLYLALNLYDYLVVRLKWLAKMRRMVVKEHNQVSATAAVVSANEII
ncbi:hypothetical protein L3X38_028971 [Prunus dulcis]|uniref:Uncharacterized protein n=1 Tax=Prunus dulcis TaxID=3755 RepID=A0AAD4Z1Z8_PRUDU|nr:hypothetical protein L3X38_028971 [Prunus dulcis]